MTTSASLHAYLVQLPGRCPGCAYHVATQGCRCEAGEWGMFMAAIRAAAMPDGTVHQRNVRPLIRGRITPKHIGGLYRRARAERLLVDTGEREPSSDVEGRNADKLDRIYRLVVAR